MLTLNDNDTHIYESIMFLRHSLMLNDAGNKRLWL